MRVVPKAVIVSASDPARPRFGSHRRLHVPREFAAVLEKRTVLRGEVFDLHLGEQVKSFRGRLGLIVPKRLVPAAMLRNAIKRQGREAFRLLDARLGVDIVLRLKKAQRKNAGDLPGQKKSWRGEIESLLRRAVEKGR